MNFKPQNMWMIVDPDGNPLSMAPTTADDAVREFISDGEYVADEEHVTEGEIAKQWNEKYYAKGYRVCLIQLSQVMVINWEAKVE